MIKQINIKKILLLFSTGIILITNTGCYNKTTEIKKSTSEKFNEDKQEKTTSVQTTEIIIEETKTSEQNKVQEEITTEENEIYSEDAVIEEFSKIEKNITSVLNEENIDNVLSKIGDSVATMIGFIWYGEEIHGVTYNELSSEAKEKVLNIYYKADAAIENKFPNYKDKIKDKYQIVSSFIKDKYDDAKYNVDIWLREKLGEEGYQKYIDSKEELKKGASESIEDMKEVKELYKQKVNDWYQKKKSE